VDDIEQRTWRNAKQEYQGQQRHDRPCVRKLQIGYGLPTLGRRTEKMDWMARRYSPAVTRILAAVRLAGMPGLAHFRRSSRSSWGRLESGQWHGYPRCSGFWSPPGCTCGPSNPSFSVRRPSVGKPYPILQLADAWAIVPLLALILLLGIAPGPLLDVIHATVSAVLR